MKLVSFSAADGIVCPGILSEETSTVLDLSRRGFAGTLDVIKQGGLTMAGADKFPLDQVKLHAPLPNPPRIFAIGLNYRDHAKESGMAIPTTPVVFFKLATAIVGPGDPIVLPKNSNEPDYEAEFAFVIGKGGYRIPASAWREHVYGYTIVNDVSARDVQFSSTQWSMSKCFPTFCPLGPVVPASSVDVADLAVECLVNGEIRQPCDIGAGDTRREDHPDRFRHQTSSNEAQHLGGSSVKPLLVVNNTNKWLRLGSVGKQVEDSQTDQEPVRCRSGAHPERDSQGITLRGRQSRKALQQRCAELMQCGERQFHF